MESKILIPSHFCNEGPVLSLLGLDCWEMLLAVLSDSDSNLACPHQIIANLSLPTAPGESHLFLKADRTLVKRKRWIHIKHDSLSASIPDPYRSGCEQGTVEHRRKAWQQGRHNGSSSQGPSRGTGNLGTCTRGYEHSCIRVRQDFRSESILWQLSVPKRL